MVRINQHPQVGRVGCGFGEGSVAMASGDSDRRARAIHAWTELLPCAHRVADTQVRAAEIAHRAQRCHAGVELREDVGGDHGIQHLLPERGMYKFQNGLLRASSAERLAGLAGAKQVRVHVDEPRHDVFSGAVHHLGSCAVDFANGGDLSVLHKNIGLLRLAARLSADDESSDQCSFQCDSPLFLKDKKTAFSRLLWS